MVGHLHAAHDTAPSRLSGIMLDSFPRRLLALIAGVLLSGWFGITLQAVEVMYRCEDGSFTNRPDAACPPYRSRGSLTVSPDGQPPSLLRDRLKGDSSTMTAVLPPPSGKVSKTGSTLCGLYDEWETLRRITSGGTVFSRSRDVARWQALSRIFLSIDTPECEVHSTVRAAHASR
jgi:hypothetical protein